MFVVDSLPAVYSKGLDTDFLWRPIRDFNLQGGLTIASTRFSHTDGDATGGVLAHVRLPGRSRLAPAAGAAVLRFA